MSVASLLANPVVRIKDPVPSPGAMPVYWKERRKNYLCIQFLYFLPQLFKVLADCRLSSMLFSPSHTVLHVILALTDCPSCYSLPRTLPSMLFSPSQTVLHVIFSLTDCLPCYSLPHRLSFMLFSPSQTVLNVILSLTDCPSCYSHPQTVLHVILSLTDSPP
ncbi:unnamed protein product, partial [Ranitomeya imitator]